MFTVCTFQPEIVRWQFITQIRDCLIQFLLIHRLQFQFDSLSNHYSSLIGFREDFVLKEIERLINADQQRAKCFLRVN